MQFDVYKNPNKATAQEVPYLLDVQNDLLADLATRVVAPLFTRKAMPKPASILNPVLEVDGHRVVMSTAELAGIRTDALGKRVSSAAAQRDEIVRAIEFVVTGL